MFSTIDKWVEEIHAHSRADGILKFFPTGTEVLELRWPEDGVFLGPIDFFVCGACEKTVHELPGPLLKNTNDPVENFVPFCEKCYYALMFSPNFTSFKTWIATAALMAVEETGTIREGYYQMYYRVNPLSFATSKTKRAVE